jgi:sugar lactone lactonase YvrE
MVTACAFGGADLHELCITTIADLQNPARQPNGGRVFRVRVPVAGQPEHLWKNQERSKS